MNAASIPSSWVGACGRMDAEHLLKVKAEMESRGLDPNDLDAVRRVSMDVAFATEIAPKMKRQPKRNKQDG